MQSMVRPRTVPGAFVRARSRTVRPSSGQWRVPELFQAGDCACPLEGCASQVQIMAEILWQMRPCDLALVTYGR